MYQFFCCIVLLAAIVSSSFSAQDSKRLEPNPLGDWRGSSVCQVRESSCRDEESLYHITPVAEKPNWFSMRGDKIVDGKAVTMGTVECRYDPAKLDFTCDLPRGVLRFSIHANRMEGTMTLPDGTLWRKINLTKAPLTKMSGVIGSIGAI
jgi:hypothetical protein